jgi:hypothetical protein
MPEAAGNRSYETADVRPRTLIWSVVIFGVVLFALALASAMMLRLWSTPHTTASGAFSARLEPTQEAPEPRLQVAPAADLQKLRGVEEARLRQYEWIDRQAGIAAIPIDRAMELLAERGRKEQRAVGRKESAKKEQP